MIRKNTEKIPSPSPADAGAIDSSTEGVGIIDTAIGQNFHDFLEEEGMLASVTAAATKRVIAKKLIQSMQATNLSRVAMAKRMGTGRSQLDRILDPNITTIQLDLLVRAARSVGRSSL